MSSVRRILFVAAWKTETLDVVVNKKPDTSEKNDEEINLNLVIVNKYRIFTGVEASAFAKVPIKWDFWPLAKRIDKDTIYCIINTRRLCGRMGMAGSHQSEQKGIWSEMKIIKRSGMERTTALLIMRSWRTSRLTRYQKMWKLPVKIWSVPQV